METKPIFTPIVSLDLTKQAPHSPRERVTGFAIAVAHRQMPRQSGGNAG